MNKNEFINELKAELIKNKISDIEDIIEEYEEHFAFKIDEGKSEEEIAIKLGEPKTIAKEYFLCSPSSNKLQRSLIASGLIFIDFFVGLLYVLLWGCVIVMGTFTISCIIAGFLMITTINIAGLIPTMPYLGSLVFGISLLGLAVISFTATFYMFLYSKQWGKSYTRWHKNMLNNNIYPSVSKQPKLTKKTAYKIKLLTMVGLYVFVASFIVAFVILTIYTGQIGFWHELNWFVN